MRFLGYCEYAMHPLQVCVIFGLIFLGINFSSPFLSISGALQSPPQNSSNSREKKSAMFDISHGRRWRKLVVGQSEGCYREGALSEIKNRLLENVEPCACQYVGFRKCRNRVEAKSRVALVASC